MRVYIVKSVCEEHGKGSIIEVYTTEAVAGLAKADTACPSEIDDAEVEDVYVTLNERLRRERIARGANPETGR